MVNIVDKRTSFQYLCDIGQDLILAKDLEECLFISRSYGPCSVFKLNYRTAAKYEYECDIFIDKGLMKGGDKNGIS